MKFLQKERSKLGTAPGTIINWAISIPDNDPNFAQSVEKLPAGYIRCDGSVYDERDYPELARILGTGEGSLYKKSDQVLGPSQFQVPDLGSKHIEAASSSNVGSYNHLTKVVGTGENATTVKKAGVGVEMFSNVGSTATIGFNGAFTIPAQTFDLIGTVGWTVPTTTETTSVPHTAMGSHGHFSGGTRVAIKEDKEYPHKSVPYYLSAADVNYTTTAGGSGGLCNDVAARYWTAKKVITGEGNCNSQACGGFDKYFLGYAQAGGAVDGSQYTDAQIAAAGWEPSKLTHKKEITTVTDTSWPGNTVVVIGNQRPYDTVNDNITDPVYPTARNVEEVCESPPGSLDNDGTAHSHIIDREIGDTTFTCTTAVTTMRPDGLEANVNISTSGVNKFDDIVSPYIVLEFLIKY